MIRRHSTSSYESISKTTIKNKNKKLHSSLSSIDSYEIEKYIEFIQYKINANEKARLIAHKASISAFNAVSNVEKVINLAIKFKQINKNCKQIRLFCLSIQNEMTLLLIEIKISLHDNQLKYIYNSIDNLNNKLVLSGTLLQIKTQPPSPIPSSIPSPVPSTDRTSSILSTNISNTKTIKKLYKKNKKYKIYNHNHDHVLIKKNMNNICKIISKLIGFLSCCNNENSINIENLNQSNELSESTIIDD